MVAAAKAFLRQHKPFRINDRGIRRRPCRRRRRRVLRRAIAAGVKIAFGTDTGVSRHGGAAQQFALMIAVGMTPIQAIRTATTSAR